MTEQNLNQMLVEALHQRDVLMQAIEKMAKEIGLYNGEAPIDGPHLLMFCDDTIDIVKSLTDRQKIYEDIMANAEKIKGTNDAIGNS